MTAFEGDGGVPLEPGATWADRAVDAALARPSVPRRQGGSVVVLRGALRFAALRRVLRIITLLACDLGGIAGSVYLGLLLGRFVEGTAASSLAARETTRWVWFAYLVTVLLFARADLYADRTRRGGMRRVAVSLVQADLICLVFALASGERSVRPAVFLVAPLLALTLLGGLREAHLHLTAWALDRAGYRRRAILVGAGRHASTVARALADRSRTRVEIVGQVSDERPGSGGVRWLGGVGALADALVREPVQEVIVADPGCDAATALDIVDLCHAHGVTVLTAPTTMDVLMRRGSFVPGQAIPLFTLRPPLFEGLDYAVKRTLDVVIAILALMLFAPLLVLVALAVKLSSRGPIIYRSVRPGIGGAPFHCLKFRTMHALAEQQQAELESRNEKSGALFKIREDPRVTGVGRILRRYSLDELPQLFNVLRGEMSMVGPRPLPVRDFERLEDWHRKRYLVLPGITGLWQISGRSDVDFDDLVRLDFLYLERWSVLLDLWIMLRTVPAVLSRRGAF